MYTMLYIIYNKKQVLIPLDRLKFVTLDLDEIKHGRHDMYHNMPYNTINRLK